MRATPRDERASASMRAPADARCRERVASMRRASDAAADAAGFEVF